jgi:hypothetical protein
LPFEKQKMPQNLPRLSPSLPVCDQRVGGLLSGLERLWLQLIQHDGAPGWLRWDSNRAVCNLAVLLRALVAASGTLRFRFNFYRP